MAGMSKRELAYLLIGLGTGLLFSVAAIVELAFWFHHMFIVGFAWRPGSLVLALPFLLILSGIVMLVRKSNKARSY